MPLKVALVPSSIQQDGSMVPRVVRRSSLSFDRLLDYMMHDTALRKEDMQVAMSTFRQAL